MAKDVTDRAGAFCPKDVEKAPEAAYIGNSYETDLLRPKAADLALAGLIRQTEDQIKRYRNEHKPDFVTENLRGALDEINKKSKPLKEDS